MDLYVRTLLSAATGFAVLTLASACFPDDTAKAVGVNPTEPGKDWPAWFAQHPQFIADGFDFPVGPPDAAGYYNAQPFGRNLHLGDDWNGKGGGDSDLGDPVYAIAHGYVTRAEDEGGGWGKVVRVVHHFPENGSTRTVESLYAHLDTLMVSEGSWLRRGQQLGTIGNAGGRYPAHLHLEIRDSAGMPLGGGYSHDTRGYLRPTEFIKAYRSR